MCRTKLTQRTFSLSQFWEKGDVLLESGKGGEYSFLFREIPSYLSYDGKLIRFYDARTGEENRDPLEQSLFQYMDEWEQRQRSFVFEKSASGLPFLGGWAGGFSYDIAREYIDFLSHTPPTEEVPRAVLFWVEGGFILDHKAQELIAFSHHKQEKELSSAIDEMLTHPQATMDRKEYSGETLPRNLSFEQGEFITAVQKIQDYISAGHTYQVNLSTQARATADYSAIELFQTLRRVNPSPYMGLFQATDFSLISGSPELLYSVKQGRLESRPIAGTRPTDENAEKNEAFSTELMGNIKEQAEHLMLVDLIRNDMGRVSQYGTVQVDEFMVCEQYSHVQHIVSHVSGQLERDTPFSQIFKSMFPGGTITGAPKVRTMQIIEETEPVSRGFYTGAMGYLSACGNQNWNILIRSILLKDGQVCVQSGAGVVIDSIPEKEFAESLQKAKALWKAIEHTAPKV